MHLREILESSSVDGDLPSFAYVDGFGDVYEYGIEDLDTIYKQVKDSLRPGEFFTWWGTVVKQLGSEEIDASIFDHIVELNRMGYKTHASDSAAPHDHPYLYRSNELSEKGYISFLEEENSEGSLQVILAAAKDLELECEYGKSYDSDAIVVRLHYSRFPAFIEHLRDINGT